MDNFLEVKNLKKYFPIRGGILSKVVGNVKAVDGISFSMKKGEIFGLVGESGCGKSTAGKTILRLHEATSGSVKLEGKTVFDVENKIVLPKYEMQRLRRDMQIIFQDPFASLDPRKSIGYIVSEGILKHKLCKSRAETYKKSIEILEMCGMPANCIKKYPHEFSGGQRQRIGIARSLALNPKFIICDEPLAALDVSIQAQVLTLLQEIIEKFDLTTLFISHDLGVVKYFCDRIAVMYLGSFVEIGTSYQIMNNPQHPYTKALISSIPRSEPSQNVKRITLKGDIPSPVDPPSGCKFHTRCNYAKAICSEKIPEMKVDSNGHMIWCHL